MAIVDNQHTRAHERPSPDAGAAFLGARAPCGSRPGSRWFCAWTHPGGEFRAELDLMGKGFEVYLPLLLEPRTEVIAPLFARYLFVQFNPARDQWRRIYRTRGVAGLIATTPEQPIPVPEGVVEALIARTSGRRVVDDPGPWSEDALAVGAVGQVREGQWAGWSGICTMSRRARVALLLSLFGREVVVEFPQRLVAAV